MIPAETAGQVPIGHGTQNGCFGCGDANAAGLQLRFFISADDAVVCRFSLDRRFQGPPGYAHGGVIATVLDEAMSKANRRRNVYAMTRQMSVDYLRPVPLEQELLLDGRSERESDRKHRCSATLRDGTGRVLATATGLFIEVKRDKLLESRS